MSDTQYPLHTPVMLNEVLTGLNINPEGIYIDATFGRGGHASAILSQLSSRGRLVVMDKDLDAILFAKSLFSSDPRVIIQHSSYANVTAVCRHLGILGKVNGFLMDLGVSSPQLDEPNRGFSFKVDGPLDMRMNPTEGQSAAEWLNQAKESDIAHVLKTYGEERFSQRIAHAIVTERSIAPILSTRQLASIVSKANPAWEKHKHPATRAFQAIRIFINHELEDLTDCLEHILEVLSPGGRLVVISFHSLEDRLVKQFIQSKEKGDIHPRKLPILESHLNPTIKSLVRKKKPTEREIQQNSRARSAVLRVAEKLEVKEIL